MAATTDAAFSADSRTERPEMAMRNTKEAAKDPTKAEIPSRKAGSLIFGSPNQESGGVEKTEATPGTAAGRTTNGKVARRRAISLHQIPGSPNESGIGAYARRMDETTTASTAAEAAARRKNATKAAATEKREAPSMRSTEKYRRFAIHTDFEKKNAAVPARKNTMAMASET